MTTTCNVIQAMQTTQYKHEYYYSGINTMNTGRGVLKEGRGTDRPRG